MRQLQSSRAVVDGRAKHDESRGDGWGCTCRRGNEAETIAVATQVSGCVAAVGTEEGVRDRRSTETDVQRIRSTVSVVANLLARSFPLRILPLAEKGQGETASAQRQASPFCGQSSRALYSALRRSAAAHSTALRRRLLPRQCCTTDGATMRRLGATPMGAGEALLTTVAAAATTTTAAAATSAAAAPSTLFFRRLRDGRAPRPRETPRPKFRTRAADVGLGRPLAAESSQTAAVEQVGVPGRWAYSRQEQSACERATGGRRAVGCKAR